MAGGEIVVREANSKRDRDLFLKVPFKTFEGCPQFVPQLFFERNEHISAKKNPYFDHAKVQLFIAERDGEIVGRISAQVNDLHIERYKDATGHFGFLDAIDDKSVFKALLDTAAGWLKQRGMERMLGPMNFSINEDVGILIDGFDTPPSVMMPHARRWYQQHVESLGLEKAKDIIAYNFEGLPEPPRAMQAMVRKAAKSGDLVVRTFSKKNLKRDLKIVIDLFNDAWSKNWGFVPMTPAEIAALGDALKMLIEEDFIAIAEYKSVPAAMAVTLPNINNWIKDLEGKLLPFGVFKILWRMKMTTLESARMPLMGVKKEFHGTPVGSALALSVIETVRVAHKARGVQRAELSWILEDNFPMRHVIESLGGDPYKTYRIYEAKL